MLEEKRLTLQEAKHNATSSQGALHSRREQEARDARPHISFP